MHGWISLHRKILHHPFFQEKRRFSKFEAWVDLLLTANYKDADVLIDYQVVKVKRGELITSEVKLADRWGWNRKTVRKFISLLEMEGMVVKTATSRWTSLTIVNYEVYQDGGTGGGTTEEQQRDRTMDTNNNVNNDNKEYTSVFLEFWSVYPRKKEKKKAYRVWQARVKEGCDPDQLVLAARRYAQECATEGKGEKFIKHAATFLGPDKHYLEYLGDYQEEREEAATIDAVDHNRLLQERLAEERRVRLARLGGGGDETAPG